MITLIASLLLERRVLVVGQSRDMVSAAVCAAQALLHPFRYARCRHMRMRACWCLCCHCARLYSYRHACVGSDSSPSQHQQ